MRAYLYTGMRDAGSGSGGGVEVVGGASPTALQAQREGAPMDVEHPGGGEGHGAARGRGLHVFAGQDVRAESVSGWAHVMGGLVTDLDIGTGGAAHDVRRPGVRARWLRLLRARRFDFAVLGGPCTTFCPWLAGLRDIDEPCGRAAMPAAFRADVEDANACWRAAAEFAREIWRAGGEFVIEHPQRRGIRGKRAYWRAHERLATPGDLPELLALEAEVGAVRLDLAQCALGGRFQKFTTLLCSPRIAEQLRWMEQQRCSRCDAFLPHEERARGRFADGSSRAAAAAAYPSEMCRGIAAAGLACPLLPRRAAPTVEPAPMCVECEPAPGDVSDDSGGDSGDDSSESGDTAIAEEAAVGAGCGWAERAAEAAAEMARAGVGAVESDPRGRGLVGLEAAVAEAVLAERARPAAFASLRNRAAEGRAQLRAAALPVLRPRRSAAQRAPSNGTPPAPGRGGRPEGPLYVSQLFLPGVYERIQRWLAQAEAALRDVAAGRPARPPARLVIPQAELQPWARGTVWDCREAGDCRPLLPSTRSDEVGCAASIDRQRVREAARELGWTDGDLIGQAGEGGLESRSACSWDTVLSFHLPGLAAHFADAAKVVEADLAAGHVVGGFASLPMVPCRVLPRDVILQPRSRVLADGSVEDYEKVRVTTNSSDGRGEEGFDGDGAPLSVNDGVPADERYVELPTVRQLGRGAAVVDEAGAADGLRAELYCFDLRSAYRFAPLQRLEWWRHVFAWLDEHGRLRFYIDIAGAFGGAYMPARFEGLTLLGMALARRRQDQFDAAHPYPPGVRAWVAERRRLQAAGALPAGEEQLRPAHGQVYLDDGAGAALNDRVPVPPELAHIATGELATRALGGEPSAPDSRAAVHLRIAIAAFESLGFEHEPAKTECGAAIVNLGFRVSVAAQRIDCPLPKRRILLRDVRELRRAAVAHEPLEQRAVERLTGRLANMAHVLPELAPHLAGGYAVSSARAQRRRGRAARSRRGWRPGVVRLRPGSRCQLAVLEMCDVAEQLLEANDGIALAAAEMFASPDDAGTLTTVTDASGEDGVGGFATHPAAPGVAWVLSDEWPADVREALAWASTPRAQRAGVERPACSMPLAELFGAWAMASAVREVAPDLPVDAVVAVGDCAPAARVLSAATSAGAQLRALVLRARGAQQLGGSGAGVGGGDGAQAPPPRLAPGVRQWLGVAVPRELNQTADTLSHPAQAGGVCAAMAAAGLRVRRVSAPASCWEALREAMLLPMGREAEAWRERGELLASRA